jgi:hypothetical protein
MGPLVQRPDATLISHFAAIKVKLAGQELCQRSGVTRGDHLWSRLVSSNVTNDFT